MGDKRLISSLCVVCLVVVAGIYPCLGVEVSAAPGKLSNVHAALQGAENCTRCHTAEKKIEPGKCLACHRELQQRIKAGTGYHKDKNEECSACHQEHNGENHSLVQWDTESFDHSETGYLLTGMHQKVKTCELCHTPANAPPRKYSRTYFLEDNRCSACHTDAHRGNHPNCTECHTTKDWSVDIW